MKHTKGEWKVVHEINVMSKSGRPICACGTQISNESRMGRDVNEANAKLIAAAPELLEAIIIANEQLTYLNEHNPKKHTTGILDMLQQAIKKAT